MDVERLKQAFPSLTPEDLEAYESVTRRLLAAAERERPRLLREILGLARGAGSKGTELGEAESLALRYLKATQKMQGAGARSTAAKR